MLVVYADAETAGFVQSEVDKAGLRDEVRVRLGRHLPPGMIDAGGVMLTAELVRAAYRGAWVLLHVQNMPRGAGPGRTGVSGAGATSDSREST